MIVLNSRRSKGTPLWLEWRAALRDRRDVRNTSGSVWTSYGQVGLGYLPDVEEYMPVLSSGYVVYSYRTPIAWVIDSEWTVPDERYSATTSQHQSLIRAAVADRGDSEDSDRVKDVQAQVDQVLAYPEFNSMGLPATDGPYAA